MTKQRLPVVQNQQAAAASFTDINIFVYGFMADHNGNTTLYLTITQGCISNAAGKRLKMILRFQNIQKHNREYQVRISASSHESAINHSHRNSRKRNDYQFFHFAAAQKTDLGYLQRSSPDFVLMVIQHIQVLNALSGGDGKNMIWGYQQIL